jgi:hypothetical protein
MNRRSLLTSAGMIPSLYVLLPSLAASTSAARTSVRATFRRLRPSDLEWPSAAS